MMCTWSICWGALFFKKGGISSTITEDRQQNLGKIYTGRFCFEKVNPFHLTMSIFLFSYEVESSADSGKGRKGYESLVEFICWNICSTKKAWHLEILTIVC